MSVTLKDIAQKIGVSYSTVSRTVNPETAALVSPKTRQRVLAAVKKYGYQTNVTASMLRRQIKRAPTIGFTSSSFPHFLCGEFPLKVFNGVIEESGKLGCDIELFPVLQGATNEISRQLRLRRFVDGIILFGSETRPEFVQALHSLQIPTVVIGNCMTTDFYPNFVYCDSRKGADKAVSHLISKGHERIATILGSLGSIDAEWRQDGYVAALERHRIPLDRSLIFQGGFNRERGYETGKLLIRKFAQLPDAVFCANDDMAIGLLKAFYELNIRCPEDIAVVGFDDIEQANYTIPPLTTVSQQATEQGRRAVRLLSELIQNFDSAGHRIEIPSELIVRASCGSNISQSVLS